MSQRRPKYSTSIQCSCCGPKRDYAAVGFQIDLIKYGTNNYHLTA